MLWVDHSPIKSSRQTLIPHVFSCTSSFTSNVSIYGHGQLGSRYSGVHSYMQQGAGGISLRMHEHRSYGTAARPSHS